MRKAKFTVQMMLDVLEECKGNFTLVAKKIGCSREYVSQKLTPLGYSGKGLQWENRSERKKQKQMFSADELRDLYRQHNGNLAAIAKQFKVTKSCIYSYMKRLGLRDELPAQGLHQNRGHFKWEWKINR
jgi:transcriptional regulator of acetoin/glycerol metabolism